MAGLICVDASIALLLLLSDRLVEQTRALWVAWREADIDLIAPPLFFSEVTSVLREHVYHRRISSEEGERAFEHFMSLPVQSVSPADLQPRAWALAKEYGLPRAYDAQYLAVADALDCELWTADRRLAQAVRVPWLRLVGAEPPSA